MLTVILYTRSGCHLCEEAKAELQTLQQEFPHRLVEVDIEQDSALQTAYALEIPVVEVGPYRLKAPFTPQELRVTLSAASERRDHLQSLDAEGYEQLVRRSREITTADRVSYWISRHYLAVINLMLLLYVGVPFLAPVLMKAGLPGVAGIIYTGYSPLCHQFGFRSWYLFGVQAYYPLADAGLSGVKDFDLWVDLCRYRPALQVHALAALVCPGLGTDWPGWLFAVDQPVLLACSDRNPAISRKHAVAAHADRLPVWLCHSLVCVSQH
jgi:glutaredoxin